MSVLTKMTCDVNRYLNGEVYYVNQYGVINTPNNIDKNGYRNIRFPTKYSDGGVVVDNNEKFYAYYNYDFKGNQNTFLANMLHFQSFNGDSSKNLLTFIDNILKSNDLVEINGLEVKNLKSKLFEAKYIIISSTEVNNDLIKNIKRYFPNIIKLKFNGCNILQETSFEKLNSSIEFYECNIDNILSFRNNKSDLDIWYSNIDRITPCDIDSPVIRFRSIGHNYHVPLKEIFLKCNFPKLTNLEITCDSNERCRSHEKDFYFLPYSAPNLEVLTIEGKVFDLDFLSRLKNICRASISSRTKNSWYDFEVPYITNGKERKKLEEKNKEMVEYYKKLYPFFSIDALSSKAEFNRLLKLTDTYYLMQPRYENELEDLIKNGPINFNIPDNQKVIDYFIARYNKLEHQKRDEFDFLDSKKYSIKNNILYEEYQRYLKGFEKIVKTKLFMYHSSGLPIIFDGYTKIKPKRIEDMPEPTEKNRYFDCEKERKELITEEFVSTDFYHYNDLSFLVSELGVGILQPGDFSKISPFLSSLVEKENRLYHVDDFRKKEEIKCFNNLLKIIDDIYDELTIEEKMYLLKVYENDLLILSKSFLHLDKQYEIDEEGLFDSINEKSNGRYKNTMNDIRKNYKKDCCNRSIMNELYDTNIEEESKKVKEYILKYDILI